MAAIINLYGQEADRAARADFQKRQSMNQAISGIGDIANTIFQYAQRKQVLQLKERQLASAEDLRTHNALTLAIGSFGQKSVGQPGLARYEKSWQRVSGNPEFKLPRNKETGEIEIPAEEESKLNALLIDDEGKMSDTALKLWGAVHEPSTAAGKLLEDEKHAIKTYGENSPQAQFIRDVKKKVTHIQPPGEGTSINFTYPSGEREKLIESQTRVQTLADSEKSLKDFIRNHGDVFGKFNLKGKAFGLKEWAQVGNPKMREDYNSTITQLSEADAAYRNAVFGAALSAADLRLARSFIIDFEKDDLPKIVGKLRGQQRTAATKLSVRKQAARSATKGVPQFDKEGNIDIDFDSPEFDEAFGRLGEED